MLESLLEKLEKTDSRFWTFVLGVLATLLVGSALYTKRRMGNKKKILENRSKTQSLLASTAESSEEAEAMVNQARATRAAVIDLDQKIKDIDARVESAKKRIDAARNIDELTRL